MQSLGTDYSKVVEKWDSWLELSKRALDRANDNEMKLNRPYDRRERFDAKTAYEGTRFLVGLMREAVEQATVVPAHTLFDILVDKRRDSLKETVDEWATKPTLSALYGRAERISEDLKSAYEPSQ